MVKISWRGCRGTRLCSSIGYSPDIYPDGLKKTTKYLSQDGRSSGKYFNPGPPEYKTALRVQTTQLKLSVQTLACTVLTCKYRIFCLLGLLPDIHHHWTFKLKYLYVN
jgi:hypothetical protein